MRQFDPNHRHLSERTERECLKRDHRVKLWLLVISLATIAVLGAAALKENVFAPWRLVQMEYQEILREKATDEWGREVAASHEIGLRQIVVPELGVMDRCVTCHNGFDDPRMANEPQPHATHPGQYLDWHEANRFGCTICHRGQGAATDFEDAKGADRHWDYPLLPPEMTQSSCGVCHSAREVADRGGETYAAGKALFEAKGCRGCHSLHGRGGSVGPKLDGEGMKVKGQLPFAHVEGPHTLPQWLQEHFADPIGVVAGSQMPNPGLSRRENRALTVYMLSLQGRDLPASYLSPERHLMRYKAQRPDERSGEELYRTFCQVCHDEGRFGRYDRFFARFVPAVRGEDYRSVATPAYVAANIREGRPGTIMPAWKARAGGLSDSEVLSLVEYLLGRSVRPEELEPEPPASTASTTGDAHRGQSIFRRQCAGCHGDRARGSLGPALDTPAIHRWASDEFLRTTITRGRRNTAMPSFVGDEAVSLAPRDVDDLIAYLRGLGNRPASDEVAAIGTEPSEPPRETTNSNPERASR